VESILITDASGLIIFSPGVDYTVRVIGDRVEIRRVLGGDAMEGQAVLIDYLVGPEPGSSTTTIGAGGSVRYDIEEGLLDGLGLYARYFHQDQNRSGGRPGLLPVADIDTILVGVDYRFWYLFMSAEYELRDSTLSPFTATRLDARYAHPLGRRSSLTLYSSYDQIDFTDDDIRTTTLSVGGRWNQLLTDRFSMNLSALWRQEQDSAGIDVEAFEQQIDLTWRYRQTTVYGAFRNVMLESDASDSLFQTFMIGLRREF
jgi:hypothetical protein